MGLPAVRSCSDVLIDQNLVAVRIYRDKAGGPGRVLISFGC